MSVIIGIVVAITAIGVSAIILLILETIVKLSRAERIEVELVNRYAINKFMETLNNASR